MIVFQSGIVVRYIIEIFTNLHILLHRSSCNLLCNDNHRRRIRIHTPYFYLYHNQRLPTPIHPCPRRYIPSCNLYSGIPCRSVKKATTPLRKHAYSNILKILPPKTKSFQIKNSDIFHISAQIIDCVFSLEPPQRGGSNEYLQSMFLSRNKKNNVYPANPSFTI